MASKANRLKTEETEETEQEKPKSSPRKSKEPKGVKGSLRNVRNFLADERTHKVFGLALLLLSFYMLVAFTSNLFSWKEDQVVAGADSNWQLLFQNDLVVANWLGKLGAITALQFMNDWFGITAYAIPFLLFLFGMKVLLDITLLPFGKTLRHTFFSVVWLSTFLGFAFHAIPDLLILGGGYGYQLSQSLNGVLGIIGTGAMLVFSLLTYLVITFNISFKRKPVEETPMEEAGAVTENIELKNSMVPDEAPHVVDFSAEEEPEEEEDLVATPVNLDPEVTMEEEEKEEEQEEPETEEDAEEEMAVAPPDGVQFEVEEAIAEDVPAFEGDVLPHAEGQYDPTLDLSSYQYPYPGPA
jgi:S-DNA-T family DNA segregation ATPase FtsK/SpoIIIE